MFLSFPHLIRQPLTKTSIGYRQMDHSSVPYFFPLSIVEYLASIHRRKPCRLFDYHASLPNEKYFLPLSSPSLFFSVSFSPASRGSKWNFLLSPSSSAKRHGAIAGENRSEAAVLGEVELRSDKGYEGGFRNTVSVGKAHWWKNSITSSGLNSCNMKER